MKQKIPALALALVFLLSTAPASGAMIGGGEGWIRIDCNVDGAAVSFDGEHKGIISGGSLTIPVYTTGSPYSSFTVSRSGYTSYSGGLSMPAEGQTVTYYATLNPVFTPTTSPPVRHGSISVETSPSGADVYLDGNYRGRAPLTISGLWPGDYTISAEMNGYRTYITTTSVSSDTHSSVYCSLSPVSRSGALYIISSPADATVILDGMYKGKTPLTISNVAAGNHILQLDSANYYDWKSTVDVPEAETRTVSATLNPMPSSTTGWVYVSSSPGGASVTLDGKAAGQTPVSGSLKLNTVAAGEHTVTLERSGYQRYTATTSVSPNTVSEVSAILVPESTPSGTGSMSVSSSPSGANILVDNNFIGISPLTAHDMTAGDHIVTFRMDGYQEYSTTALVNAGTTSTVSAALLPVTPAPKSPASVGMVLLALAFLGFVFAVKPE